MLDKLKDMKVEKKLKTCFTFVVLIASFAGVLGLFVLLYCNIRYDRALVDNGFSQGEIGMFSTALMKEPSIIREMILIKDEASMKESEAELIELQAATDAAYETMKIHCTTAKELEYIKQIDELLPDFRDKFDQVKVLALANKNDEALDVLLTVTKPKLRELAGIVTELIQYNAELGDKVSDTLTLQAYVMIGVMVLVIILATAFAMKISRMISGMLAEPITNIQKATAELAAGHLDIYVEKTSEDELGDMTVSFNTAINLLKEYIQELSDCLSEISAGNFNVTTHADFRGDFRQLAEAVVIITDSLSATIGNIQEVSDQVALGSNQMAESAQALAEGATDQAASVQELTATIQDITETVVSNSEKANKSSKDAETFKKDAEESSKDIQLLNQAMERITSTSQEIANIIAAIEDIASQTNLLSLNASIEAARAGEAGKGFAVVADQIGKLASDSAASAVDTKKLIENSLNEIESGTQIMVKATSAIEAVIDGINALAISANEISELSDTQAEAMKQLEEGVGQISEVIQNNSAAAQETSATSQELSAQAEGLEQLVGQFTLK